MDPELKVLLGALVEGQVKLAGGLAQTNASVGRLADGLAETNASVGRLADAQARSERRLDGLESALRQLAEAQTRTEQRLGTLTDRVGRLSDLMIRGYTEAAERHVAVIARLDKLEEH